MFPRPPEITFSMEVIKDKVKKILQKYKIQWDNELDLDYNVLSDLDSIKKDFENEHFRVITYKHLTEKGLLAYKFSQENDQFSITIRVKV